MTPCFPRGQEESTPSQYNTWQDTFRSVCLWKDQREQGDVLESTALSDALSLPFLCTQELHRQSLGADRVQSVSPGAAGGEKHPCPSPTATWDGREDVVTVSESSNRK